MLVVEHAYHGHTHALIGLSPYKFHHSSFAGCGKPEWVIECPAPDVFRGPHTGADAGKRYAEAIEEQCTRGPVDAFFIESGMSVGGVILPPPGFLSTCYAAVRAAGGVCVADEVQTGLGRFGEWWWGFEEQGVVPDIVTMGKPMGNGMPLAAVVCTREIAEAFAAGPEYFNTFGGNPVCAAAGAHLSNGSCKSDPTLPMGKALAESSLDLYPLSHPRHYPHPHPRPHIHPQPNPIND